MLAEPIPSRNGFCCAQAYANEARALRLTPCRSSASLSAVSGRPSRAAASCCYDHTMAVWPPGPGHLRAFVPVTMASRRA